MELDSLERLLITKWISCLTTPNLDQPSASWVIDCMYLHTHLITESSYVEGMTSYETLKINTSRSVTLPTYAVTGSSAYYFPYIMVPYSRLPIVVSVQLVQPQTWGGILFSLSAPSIPPTKRTLQHVHMCDLPLWLSYHNW